MEKLIMIKYGELTTKKENINLFINTLKQNIKFIVRGRINGEIYIVWSWSICNKSYTFFGER